MTFTEAAAEVLRLVGKPLHYKDITDLAIQKNLLSHVGKSPEVTMGSRLAALLKKTPKENPLVRIKPGVFALRAWEEGGPPGPAADAGDLAVVASASASGSTDDAGPAVVPAPPSPPSTSVVALPAAAEEHKSAPAPDEVLRAEMASKASEMFSEDEDDDKPILGEDPAEAAGGRRRRRRRRRPGSDEAGPAVATDTAEGLPSYTVSPAFGDGLPAPNGEAREGGTPAIHAREGGDRPARDREPREPREPRETISVEAREPREGRRDRGDRGGGERSDRGGGERSDRGADRGAPKVELPVLGENDEAVGRDMADTLVFLLAGFDRNAGPVPLRALAEAGQRRARLQGEISVVQSMIAAAARADNLRRASVGQRPRFRIAGGRIGATDWALGADLVRAEAELLVAIERFREASRRTLARKIGELPGHALVELTVTLLEKLGVHQIRGLRRPGTPGGETHLTGTLRGPTGDQVLAIVIRKDGKEIGRERVIEVRGSLHHYGAATAGFLVTTGTVLSGAREEAGMTGATPVAIFDGMALAKACEDHGVGTIRTVVPVPLPDVDFLEAIRGTLSGWAAGRVCS